MSTNRQGSPTTLNVYETGALSDGVVNCVKDSIPVLCNTGFHSDGNGNYVPETVPIPSVCQQGYLSDGIGNCVQEDSNLTSCG